MPPPHAYVDGELNDACKTTLESAVIYFDRKRFKTATGTVVRLTHATIIVVSCYPFHQEKVPLMEAT